MFVWKNCANFQATTWQRERQPCRSTSTQFTCYRSLLSLSFHRQRIHKVAFIVLYTVLASRGTNGARCGALNTSLSILASDLLQVSCPRNDTQPSGYACGFIKFHRILFAVSMTIGGSSPADQHASLVSKFWFEPTCDSLVYLFFFFSFR